MAIPDFYAGKNVFITGGAGFIGKVLIEKLLRSCPKVGKIYLLFRPKKGTNFEDRIKKIVNTPIFDNIKEQQPCAISEKLIPIAGDMMELELGLSKEDRATLIREVNIIFHCAASIRFDDPLQDALKLNTRGTRELCQLALEMKNICVFEHISTTYCNCDRMLVEEKLYPPPADWRQMLKIQEKVDKNTLQILSKKITGKHPNTYTFTKALSEHVVNDLLKGKIPTVILRPSIVSNAWNEPLPGWVDNFNGASGLVIAGAKGVLRYPFLDPYVAADIVPVDFCVRRMITVAWAHGSNKNTSEVAVYNSSGHGAQHRPFPILVDVGKRLIWKYPINNVLWYPAFGYTTSLTIYYVNVIFLHLIPAVFFDAGLRLMGQKPIIVALQRKAYIAVTALLYFMKNQWTFPNEKMVAAETVNMPKNCIEEFGNDIFIVLPEEYIEISFLGNRKHLLKDYSDYDTARKKLYRMYLLDMAVKLLLSAGIFWLVFIKLNLISCVVLHITDYLNTFGERWLELLALSKQ